jgi:hypothetical protein
MIRRIIPTFLFEADGAFFVQFEEVAGGEGGGGFRVGDFFAVELDGAQLDEAADVGVGSFLVEGGGVGVGDDGDDVAIIREIDLGPFGVVGVAGEAGFEGGAGVLSVVGGVVAGDDFFAEGFFGVHGVEGGIEFFAEEEEVVSGHEVIGDGHDFAEHIVGSIADADVVAVGLGHFLYAVGAFEEGHGEDDLLGHIFGLLHIAADEDIEELVGAAEFDIGFDLDGVPALHDGILDFVEADFLFRGEAIFKVIALEHLLHGDAGIEAEDVFVGHFSKPFAIVNDLGFGAVEDFESLVGISFGVGEDFIAGERWAGGGASAGVADGGGEVSDDEDGLVAEFLELSQFFDDQGVAEVDIGGGGIDAEFRPEGAIFAEFIEQLFIGDDLGGAFGEEIELLFGRHGRREVE